MPRPQMPSMQAPEASSLTAGERLTLARMRLRLTQREMARTIGVTRHNLQAMELDRWGDVVIDGDKIRGHRTASDVVTIARHEQCHVARRRTGREVGSIAKQLGCSRQWVNEMESGREDCANLCAFWGF